MNIPSIQLSVCATMTPLFTVFYNCLGRKLRLAWLWSFPVNRDPTGLLAVNAATTDTGTVLMFPSVLVSQCGYRDRESEVHWCTPTTCSGFLDDFTSPQFVEEQRQVELTCSAVEVGLGSLLVSWIQGVPGQWQWVGNEVLAVLAKLGVYLKNFALIDNCSLWTWNVSKYWF